MEQKYIYVVFSATPYKMGRLIRFITATPYNHVSIALDSNLDEMYGFARRYYRTPFYGGFVKENLARYQINGQCAQVKICQIPIESEAFLSLRDHIDKMYCNKEQYLYNFLSILTMPFHRRANVKDARTCVEFAVDVLHHSLGNQLPLKYYSIKNLAQHLDSYHIYQGAFSNADSADPDFFARKPVAHPVYCSISSMTALIPRWIFKEKKVK